MSLKYVYNWQVAEFYDILLSFQRENTRIISERVIYNFTDDLKKLY